MVDSASPRRNVAANAAWVTLAVVAGAGLAALAMALIARPDTARNALRQCDEAVEALQERLSQITA